jgi:subtilase family serine protease
MPIVPLPHRRVTLTLLLSLLPFVSQIEPANAQSSPQFTQPADRVVNFIDDEQRVILHGNRYPVAAAQFDVGAVQPDYRMERMVLTLYPDAAQQSALTELIDGQHNPESAFYHQWLTPEQFGASFGASESDIKQITGWLQSHGFEVEETPAGSLSIIFSGTAAQVESAFHTPIHIYKVGREVHHSNARDPEIPAALAGVVKGVVSLHDFRSAPQNNGARLPAAPEFTAGSSYYLAPADFATIYNVAPLYQQSITGTGESVAIVARSNINLSDVRQFRTAFGLPANDPQIIVNGTDPGIWSSGEETEADLDVEWAGAVARGATIKFVVSKSTSSTDGVDLSAQYIVNHNLAPVMTTSFGLCEAALGSSGNSFLNNLWQQATAQGISVFVSSGDNGAAGCDSASATKATQGLGVNGLCSTPYSICVGGSEFSDPNPSLYWSSSNAAGNESSALSYIPEVAWNESGPSSGLWSSGGGASRNYAKPSWQTGTGVPSDGKRDVPDVALAAAGKDGYLLYQNGGLYVVGGTSAASPSFAGVMALVVQSTNSRQGDANTAFYSLAGKQRSGGAVVFHDIISGNNSVPGQTGFSAAAGYDEVTGLGSINAAILVGHWSDATAMPAFKAMASVSALTVNRGSNGSFSVSVMVSGGFNAAVSFGVTGLPSGATAAFTPATLAAPGSGNSTLKIGTTSAAKAGNYSLIVKATSGSTSQQIPLALTLH